MSRLVCAALAACLLLPAQPALAHPHIFIDATATITFDDSGAVASIRNAWTFDEAFSAWQVQGLDTDGDGTVSSAEMQELADLNMEGLAEYGYYTFAGEGPDNLRFTNGRNPVLEHVDGRSTLTFDVDLAAPYRIREALEIAINDPEYYVAIAFADESAVRLVNAPDGCAVTLEPGHELAPELAEQLYQLPPDVTELPPDLAVAMRGVQGAIVLECPTAAIAETPVPPPGTALEAVTAIGTSEPDAPAAVLTSSLPFGGPPAEPGFGMPTTGLFGWLATQQRNFWQALTSALGALHEDNTAFWLLGTLSFLYGVFHAAGPGHGKVVISSYVLANEHQLRRGALLSFAAAMVQALVAIGFVLVAAALLHLTATAMSEATNWIGIVSYALVAALGAWLIARKVFGLGHSHGAPSDKHAHAHHHDHDHHGAPHDHLDHHNHNHDHDHAHHVVTPDRVGGGWREQLGVVLAVGLRPCSGALVVLAFALSQDLLAAGILAVLLMGLGTGLTVAILASFAVGLKKFAVGAAGANGALASGLVWWTELAGAVLVFGFGVLLLLASL